MLHATAGRAGDAAAAVDVQPAARLQAQRLVELVPTQQAADVWARQRCRHQGQKHSCVNIHFCL